ncbi:phage tail tube protein [Frigidibacter sp. MR17.14]|uniref:phage tail tube protein n=1 Tax=Frigidibacter sp. MR17.14 TaxID=3126509 RepID=UPI003012C2F4
MARAQGARAQLALAFETTYGTPPASGFTRMPFASAGLSSEQPLLANELLGYGRDPLAPQRDVITAGGEVRVPIDLEAFALWLKATLGVPVTTGAGPYTHTFTSGAWTLPSMSIEIGMPEVPYYGMHTGCMVDRLTWSMARSGLLTAGVTIVSQGEDVATASAAGTLADIDLQRFGHFAGSVKRNGAQIGNIVGAEITYANNLDRVETIRADGKIDGADPTMAALSGNITVRFADTLLVDQATSGASCDLEFGYDLGAGKRLTFSLPNVFLPRPRLEVPGPQGVQATFAWQAAQGDGQPMLTVVLENDVESYA